MAPTDGTSVGHPLCWWDDGWSFDGADGWETWGDNSDDNTFYAETAVEIGSAGSASALEITVIAEGSIDMSGSMDLSPHTPGLMFVTDGDLVMAGSPTMLAEGQLLVHEQMRIAGNPSIIGQILVENATSIDPLVTTNAVTNGNVTITYDGGLGDRTFSVRGWRDVRDDD